MGVLEALLAEPLGKLGLSVVAKLEPARVGDRKGTEYDPGVCVLAFTIIYAPVDPKTKNKGIPKRLTLVNVMSLKYEIHGMAAKECVSQTPNSKVSNFDCDGQKI